jgi:dienelactone hydrolase
MSSIIEGYNYDVFISYRQKDNKHDGWVSEFVDNLKGELGSMFKDEVSVYFDINPSDYLLESYDVDASLRDKLKCLVFIPIISRTYCDPKAFAWDNELKAFVYQASADKFGFKVRLPNGNVASRVLPVRIHDLDAADIKLFESVVGGVMRSIDFVYKETGVNRQLRAKDDDIIKSPNQILYRDQINKVALTLKDIIESMKFWDTPSKVNEKVNQIKESVEKKEDLPEEPVVADKNKAKKKLQSDEIPKIEEEKRLVGHPFKSKILVPLGLLVITILIISILLINRQTKIKWAKEKALSEINNLFINEKYSEAFNIALKAEKYISKEPEFKEISRFISKLSIQTNPTGADVYIRKYSDITGIWLKIGTTPIDSFKLPPNTYYIARVEKKGYENIQAVFYSSQNALTRKLFPPGTIPDGMVDVEGLYSWWSKTSLPDYDYFIDRYEVINKQFKEFVDKGGYNDQKYWKNDIIKNGKVVAWSEAMKEFIDKTGRPGPSTWEAGDYPENQEDYPVSGISWYEAAAYADYVGKELPTIDHWCNAAWSNNYNLFNFCSRIAPLSNFNGTGPELVGKNQGITCFGAFDMAGNVREWCWNETPVGRVICGGAWDNVSYMYSQWSQLSPWDRSSRNGLRCVKYNDENKTPEIAFRKVKINYDRDFTKEKPVTDEVFKIYKNQFLYDNIDLRAKIESIDTSFKDWSIEKVTYDAAYGNERIIAYLFLPKKAISPFQTMIYFPGTDAVSVRDLVKYQSTIYHVDFILKNGRAVLYPVYKGTYERQVDLDPIMTEPNPTHEYTDWLIKWVKDFKRSVDYLETRSDIDTSKLGYFGTSWGGMMGGIIPAVEDRLKLSILYAGGFDLITGSGFPEVDAINYVSRIKMPVLMLNGKYDSLFPYETTVIPFLDLLGTPVDNKKSLVYETDHDVPQSEMIKETLIWLDKYFGPVKK